jgi:hypothetical protein
MLTRLTGGSTLDRGATTLLRWWMKLMSEAHKLVVKKLPEDYPPWGENDRESSPDGWYGDCSAGCIHASWLEDAPADWLVCLNPKSHRAGLLTFEHQGCPQAEYPGESE